VLRARSLVISNAAMETISKRAAGAKR